MIESLNSLTSNSFQYDMLEKNQNNFSGFSSVNTNRDKDEMWLGVSTN